MLTQCEVQRILQDAVQSPAQPLARDDAIDRVLLPEGLVIDTTPTTEISTTQAFVRFLTQLLRDKAFGPRVVPILVDEARTPLIISGPAQGATSRWYSEFARLVRKL